MKQADFSFWGWLARGSGGSPGYGRLANRWLILHAITGGVLTFFVRVDIATAANTVLFPLVGLLVGLSFAWAGNAQALLRLDEIERLTSFHEGGLAEYVFVYQAAILAVLVTLVAWALAGLRVFDDVWPTNSWPRTYSGVKLLLFILSSLTIRECWQVVLGAQRMLLARREIRRLGENDPGSFPP